MEKGNSSDRFFNILTVLMLVGVCCVGVWFVTVFAMPQSPFNPFIPPPTPLPTLTPSPTLPLLAPTFTPLATETAGPSPTLRPSATPLPTFTPFSIVTPPTEAVTPSPEPVYAFIPLQGHPRALGNIIHSDLGCSWLGVAGQVTYQNGAPVTGLVVKLSGTLVGQAMDKLTLTGSAPNYGPGGYEFVLGDEPVGSFSELYVQLLDQSGTPISDRIVFNTYADCDRNLILISFEEVGD